ncbi:MAG: DUF2100 domain-containing protein [Hadesarchaea archaeon]|nr:DUF2100 domain-containing protein [Hadesarchaea archaeon]
MTSKKKQKTRDIIYKSIDLEQIWRETIPPEHKLNEKQAEEVQKLLDKIQKDVEELLILIGGSEND